MASPIISNVNTISGSPDSRSFTVTLENTADRDNVIDIAAWTCATSEVPADPHFVPESATLIGKDPSAPYTWVCAFMPGCGPGNSLCVATVERWIGGRAVVNFPAAGQE